MKDALHKFLPNRFANRWLDLHAPAAWTNSGLAEIERGLHHWNVFPAGTEGFDKAEVTAGGVDTRDLPEFDRLEIEHSRFIDQHVGRDCERCPYRSNNEKAEIADP